MDIRDWMVVIGAGLILAVLVDAVRRVYRERRSELRLNAKMKKGGEGNDIDVDISLLSELPNGGARVLNRGDALPASDNANNTSDHTIDDPGSEPIAMVAESLADDLDGDVLADRSEHDINRVVKSDTQASVVDVASAAEVVDVTRRHAMDDLVDGFSSQDEQPETLDWLEEFEPNTDAESEPDARLPRGIEPHVFVLNVVARAEAGFAGKDILHILLACDLRFGDMDFFHRHEQAAGRGPIQFSVSNMMSPGVFDIDTMPQLHAKGLMFFVTLPGPADMLKAFDYMYETAKTVARNLDGDILDETRSAVTQQSLEHMRQKIRELERRILVLSER